MPTPDTLTEDLRESGIERIGRIPWGTHLCQFYESKDDLIDILVPYFRAGLESNEYCMWITSAPLDAEEAAAALRSAVPDLDERIHRGQIEILPHDRWYTIGGVFDLDRVLRGWEERHARARARGYDGIRVTGNTAWLEETQWADFTEYEEAINSVIGRLRMMAICTYSIRLCGGSEVIDVVDNHQFALVKRHGAWDALESSERKRMAEALRNSEERLRLLFEHMGSGSAYNQMIYQDGRPVDFVFLEVNGAFERLTGLKRDRVLGRRATEVIPQITADDFDWMGTLGRVAGTGEGAHFERRSAGRWYSISAYSPVRGYFVSIVDDITDRRNVEEQRKDMIRAITHDLRTPLSVISLSADAMVRHPEIAPASQMSDLILRNCRQMQTMLQDLADTARLESGMIPLRPRRIEIHGFIEELVHRLAAVIDSKRLSVQAAKDLPAIEADPDQLGRILMNLLTNAAKYSPADRPVRLAAKQDGDSVRFTVIDQGEGISADDLPRIFDRFYRANTARRVDGLGLGLYICRMLVEAHGGRISVESEPGRGSRFHVLMPAGGGAGR